MAGSASTPQPTAPGTIVPGQWQHLASTWDGTTKPIYIDGVELATSGGAAIVYDAGPMLIGCDANTGSSAAFFVGSLDDLQIYDRALNAGEIGALAAR